jgi:hypothetical protein
MAGNPTSTRPKITSSSFGLSTAGERLGGKYKTIKISSPEKATSNSLNNINKTLDSILNTLSGLNKQSLRESELSRRESEKKKRQSREQGLESKTFDGIKKALSVITKPFESIFDKIWNFLYYTILGKIGIKLIDWFANPENESKVKSLIRFVTDWWPALLGGYILFGTTFGRLIRSTTGMVGRFIFQIGRVAIPQLLRFISSNPLIAAGAVTGLAAGGAEMWRQSEEEKQIQKEANRRNLRPEDVKSEVEKSKASPFALFGQGMSAGFSGGGFATSGLIRGPKGVDKVPAMLTDGEFVMSAGAVQKYGVDTLESMNAAGGGTNQPKIINGATYAYGGGPIGDVGKSRSNTPFSKDPIDAIQRFIKHRFGVDVDRPPTWGPPSPKTAGGSGGSSIPTGSLLSDPIGATMRIAKQLRIPTPNLPSGGSRFKMPGLPSGGIKMPGLPSPKKGGFLDNLKSATYRDAGSIYAKQMLGGFGGPVNERDLSKESQAELQKAIARAKKRTGSEIAKAESKIKELRAQGAKDGNPALETQKSFLKKLKEGGIRVQYTDYADEKGNMSKSAENAKNILGQFWAKERSKKEGGGYRIEDKYDFDMMKIKDKKTGKMRDMTGGELWNEGVLGKGKTIQQRLQAAYLLNPFKGRGDVDMVLGGKRTAAESWGLSGSKTMLGGMLGISGKPKTKNEKALEAKRPWWDKMGWFGGTSGQMTRDQKAKQGFAKNNPSATLYNKPQKNTGQPYKSRFARPRNAGVPPVKPPVKPAPKVVRVSKPIGTGGGGISKGSNSQKAPSPSPRHPRGTGTTQRTTGTKR